MQMLLAIINYLLYIILVVSLDIDVCTTCLIGELATLEFTSCLINTNKNKIAISEYQYAKSLFRIFFKIFRILVLIFAY